MRERFDIVNRLHFDMMGVYEGLIDALEGLNNTEKICNEKAVCRDSFVKSVNRVRDILMEYFIVVMGNNEKVLTYEWLLDNISDDNSYILADEAPENESIVVEVYERDSYIQKEYIEAMLALNDLVKKSDNEFKEYGAFYKKYKIELVGLAKMLMYHAEDLEDMIACEEAEFDNGMSLKEFVESLRDKNEWLID